MSEVLPAWKRATCVLIGSGPSLTREHVELVRAACASSATFSIVINASYLWAPWADVCYFADAKFWRWHTEGVDMPGLNLTAAQVKQRFALFPGQKCSIKHGEQGIIDESVHLLGNKGGSNHSYGISRDPQRICTGNHSGYQALNIAILSGASRIILLGYDGTVHQNGQSHFHGGHPTRTPASAYQMYREAFSQGEREIRASGATVLNCSPGSTINSFDRSTIEKELRLELNEGGGVEFSAAL